MLDDATLKSLSAYAEKMTRPVEIRLFGGEHPKRQQLTTFLEQVAGALGRVTVTNSQTDAAVREGLSFELVEGGERTGVVFSGIPGGHEFSSFVLAVLQAGGAAIKLDEGIQRQIRAISTPLSFETIISLDCHVCPDVVQALNQMALINPLIRHEMIDGALHQSLVNERQVQGVPTIFCNKKPFANGGVSVSEILDKLGDEITTPVEVPQESDSTVYDVALIGGGPAAISAAIYIARKGLNAVILAEKVGGQLNDTQGIENFISIDYTTGPKLTSNLRRHLEAHPVRIREEIRVKGITTLEGEEEKQVQLSTGETIRARVLIIATGARWRELGVPGERENIGRGVAYCPHCDGPFFKGKDVTVVGGGNSGVEAALDLAGIAKSVTVLEFLDTLKADQVLIEKMEQTSNVSYRTGVATKAIVSENGHVTALELQDRKTEEMETHYTNGVFIQIGLVPNSSFAKGVVDLSHYGEILVNSRCETNVPGIFACGDVTNVPFKQIIISMGEGAKAALSAFEYLLKQQPAKP